MILYHGSNLTVSKPKILTPNRFLDFGNGFYTTSNYEQAKNFAKKIVNRKKEGVATISIYEFDETNAKKLNTLSFLSANEAWLDFVSNNRNGIESKEKYDLIYGPVADDDVFQTFILYTSGVLSKEQTLETLKIKKLYNQYAFTSEKSLDYLFFIGKEELHDEQ